MKADIQSYCKSLGPKSGLNLVSKNMGGVTGSRSPCELLRNEYQVSYIKKQSSGTQLVSSSDKILAFMLSAKDEDDKGKFV